jgi:hypothetical protein
VNGRSSGSSTEERCWGTYRQAAESYLAGRPNGRAGGVGIAMLARDDVITLDLDRCYDRARGAFTNDVARNLAAEADTYAELSPGGGVHLFGRCTVSWTKKIVSSPMKVELFNSAQFVTVTGDWLPSTPNTLNDITALVTRLVPMVPDEIDPRVDPRTLALVAASLREPGDPLDDLDDEERAADALVLRRMFAHEGRGDQDRQLWKGDTSAYGGDHSRADLGLCNRLALFCQGDVYQMDRLFRRSGLMREKWDEIHYKEPPAAYGQVAIAKAVSWFRGLDEQGSYEIRARQGDIQTDDRQGEATADEAVGHAGDNDTDEAVGHAGDDDTDEAKLDGAWEAAEDLIDGLGEDRDPDALFANIEVVGRLNKADYARFEGRLDEAGIKVNKNHLRSAYKEAHEAELDRRRDEEIAASGLPLIETYDRPTDEVADEALAALVARNKPPTYFKQGGALVRLRDDPRKGGVVEQLDEGRLAHRLTRVARFVASKGRRDRAGARRGHARMVDVPQAVTRDILAAGHWPVPEIEGVTRSPAIRLDGSILTQAGYDAATRLYYAPPPGFELPPVSANPTAAELEDAVALIREMLVDFPFDDDGGASYANAVALLLTPLVRPAIDGCVPLAAVSASDKGTGKGLLVQVANQVALGRWGATMSPPHSEEEWKKTIFAQLLENPQIVNIDNVYGPIKSTALEEALTTGLSSGRILGQSRIVEVPNRAIWTATGNNLSFGQDMLRRFYEVRLNARRGTPWQRDPRGFRHPDLLRWIGRERPRILHAAFTGVRAWYAAGRPAPAAHVALANFQEWADLVGGVLEVMGVGGFLANLPERYASSEEDQEWAGFLAALRSIFGPKPVTVKVIVARMAIYPDHDVLVDALPEQLAEAYHNPLKRATFSRSLARQLSSKRDQRFGPKEYYVTKGPEDAWEHVGTWVVHVGRETLPPSGTGVGGAGEGGPGDDGGGSSSGPPEGGGPAGIPESPESGPAGFRNSPTRSTTGAEGGFPDSRIRIPSGSEGNLPHPCGEEDEGEGGGETQWGGTAEESGDPAPRPLDQAQSGLAGSGIQLASIPALIPAGRCAQCQEAATFAPWGPELGIFLCDDHKRAFLPFRDEARPTPTPLGVRCRSCGKKNRWRPAPGSLIGFLCRCVWESVRRVAPSPTAVYHEVRAYAWVESIFDVNDMYPYRADTSPDGILKEHRYCIACVHQRAIKELYPPFALAYLCEDCLRATHYGNRPDACKRCSGWGSWIEYSRVDRLWIHDCLSWVPLKSCILYGHKVL